MELMHLSLAPTGIDRTAVVAPTSAAMSFGSASAGNEVQVATGEWMPTLAVDLGCICRRKANASQGVHSWADWLHMPRVDACSITAQVIDLQASGYLSDQVLVRPTVGAGSPSSVPWANPKHTITVFVDGRVPRPANVREYDFREEPALYGFGCLHVGILPRGAGKEN